MRMTIPWFEKGRGRLLMSRRDSVLLRRVALFILLLLSCALLAGHLTGSRVWSSFQDNGRSNLPPGFGYTALPSFSTPPTYPLKISANGRYIVDQNNQPVFFSGDAAWSLIVQLVDSDVDYYLSNRQQKGFNAIVVNLIDHAFATNAPSNIYGDAPFTGAPFTTPNEAYFSHADYVISDAAQHGILVLLDPLYLGYNCGSEGWCAEVQAASTAALTSWGNYVGNRYKSFENIVWVVGGDADPTAYAGLQSKVSAFVTGLKQNDTVHLVTAHNVRGGMAVTPWSGAAWLNVNNIYTNNLTYPLAQTAYNYLPTLPFFLIEAYYENEHSMSAQGLRAEAYWTILSGGFGYIFGNCPVWSSGYAPSWCDQFVSDWKTALDKVGSVDMMNMQKLFSSLAWQNLVPDWNHVTMTGGYGAWGGTDYATAARNSDGSLILAYMSTRRTVTIDMTKLSSSATARWYDPTNGTYSAISGAPFPNTGTKQFTPPSNNASGDGDWVLTLTIVPTFDFQTYLPMIFKR